MRRTCSIGANGHLAPQGRACCLPVPARTTSHFRSRLTLCSAIILTPTPTPAGCRSSPTNPSHPTHARNTGCGAAPSFSDRWRAPVRTCVRRRRPQAKACARRSPAVKSCSCLRRPRPPARMGRSCCWRTDDYPCTARFRFRRLLAFLRREYCCDKIYGVYAPMETLSLSLERPKGHQNPLVFLTSEKILFVFA